MNKIILGLLAMLLLTACTDKNKTANVQSGQTTNLQSEQTDEKDFNTDTIKVEGKTVVFFAPSQQEYDSMPHDPDSGIDEVLSDFTFYADKVSDSMKLAGYETTLTGSRFIQIKLNNGTVKLFDRLATDEHIVGNIFSDGIQEPLIEYGVGTDIDLMSSFRSFNKN